jgi:hypothetical protein
MAIGRGLIFGCLGERKQQKEAALPGLQGRVFLSSARNVFHAFWLSPWKQQGIGRAGRVAA